APQGVEDLLPGAVLPPGDEVIPGGALGLQVVRQHVPLAAGARLVHQGVHHLAEVHLPRPASRLRRGEQVLDQVPLPVRQVRPVRLAHSCPLLAWLPCPISLLVLELTGILASRIAFYSRAVEVGYWALPKPFDLGYLLARAVEADAYFPV